MYAIEAGNVSYSYVFAGTRHRSLDNISLCVKQGEFVAILGHNGSGKTTLARHLNALLPLQSGTLTVGGIDASGGKELYRLRQACGMVFQNPENQFVSSVAEEDLAFGPRNFGVPEEEIPGRVSAALEAVGLTGFEQRCPQLLSGGQKQRLAIAGVLAAEPDILVFDEVTAMLDPAGRQEVLGVIQRLHGQGKTIVMISHYVEEAVSADRVILMHDGTVLAEGTPRELLPNRELLAHTGLVPPVSVQLYYDLKDAGIVLPCCPVTNEELVELLCQLN